MNQEGISGGREPRPQMGSAGFFLQQQHQNQHQNHHQQQHQLQQLPHQSSGLARLPSVYSLTFDEFQTALGSIGKDFGSMNMDELIRSIWTAEETQAMTTPLTATVAPPPPVPMAPDASGSGMPLQKQGSLMKLPRTLSQKTVDEVWRDLFNETGAAGVLTSTSTEMWAAAAAASAGNFQEQQRQPTLGEMTLEEFLVRAGVVRDEVPQQQLQQQQPMKSVITSSSGAANARDAAGFYQGADLAPNKNIDNNNMGLGLGLTQQMNIEPVVPLSQMNGTSTSPTNNMTLDMVGVGLKQTYSPPLHQAAGNNGRFRNTMVNIASNPVVNSSIILPGTTGVTVATTTRTTSPPRPLVPDVCPKSSNDMPTISPTPYAFNIGLTKKRTGVEKVIERRQRRMIKNRESAARSRARKQAYTMELEAEVAKLKEQNEELQNKQAKMQQQQKTQVLEIINRQQCSKRLCLRRAQTGPW